MDESHLQRQYRFPTMSSLFPDIGRHSNSSIFRKRVDEAVGQYRAQFLAKYITNRSTHLITPYEQSVLLKGLKFVPSPQHSPRIIDNAINQTKEIFNKHKFFSRFPYIRPPRTHPFHLPSTWKAPADLSPPNPPTVRDFFQSHPSVDSTDINLSPEEQRALRSLSDNPHITIKRADKGGGVVILNKTDYVNQIMSEHLNDATTYQPLDHCPTRAIANDTNTLIDFLLCQHHIDEATAAFLRPPSPARTPIFYGLPKIHKPQVPLRPIVSGFDSPTDNLAKYMTTYLQPLAERTASYVKDSSSFKSFLNSIPALPPGAFLVTADVTSLYTNIPTDEGISRVCDFIDANRQSLPRHAPNTSIFKFILQHILTSNSFSFMDFHYLQISGTAMGCRMAPPYANIFLDHYDHVIQSLDDAIRYYKRYIDDIFFIYFGDIDSLRRLEARLNLLHPSIKFTLKFSSTSIDYLDMMIYLDQLRHIRTSLYRKPTDCQAYLHALSFHPSHTTSGIIYSQALRYNRLIDDDTHLQIHLLNLTKALIVQGYDLQTINRNIARALSRPQAELLLPSTTPRDPTAFHNTVVLPYSNLGLAFADFLKGYTHNLSQSSQTVAPSVRVVFSRNRTISDLITHTATPPFDDHPTA